MKHYKKALFFALIFLLFQTACSAQDQPASTAGAPQGAAGQDSINSAEASASVSSLEVSKSSPAINGTVDSYPAYSAPFTPSISLTKKELQDYASVHSCFYNPAHGTLNLTLSLPCLPESDDQKIYLFAIELYDEDPDFSSLKPLTSTAKAAFCLLECPFEEAQLYQEFVPAVLLNGSYVPLASGICIDNPDALAGNQHDYPEYDTKKGLLLDPVLLGTPLLTELGVKHAIYNIPLSLIMGETTDEAFPTITYEFRGNTYYFNGAVIDSYDNLFTYLSNIGMISTAIVLNDWDDSNPDMIHPLARNRKSGAYYYAFNTAEEEGCQHLEAIASFLAKRYSSGKHGLVSGWVIANEINQSSIWNYMDTKDLDYYAAEFEKSLRIFYNAVKSNYAGARVYFSIDHDWNSNPDHKKKYFNSKELLTAVNKAALKRGNYDWNVAIHPYPEPLTRVNFWSESNDKSEAASTLTMMNLNVITDFLGQEEFLDTHGNMRHLSVTELGFSSTSGEKLQAAAFAYCYYILDANPYIDTFFMNRQTDASVEVKQGLAFGLYEYDHSDKFITDVFKYIDTDKAKDYTDFMLNILNANSLEEALSWAQ